jgi:hypothetical protein
MVTICFRGVTLTLPANVVYDKDGKFLPAYQGATAGACKAAAAGPAADAGKKLETPPATPTNTQPVTQAPKVEAPKADAPRRRLRRPTHRPWLCRRRR